MLNLAVIAGSGRPDSQSKKVAQYLLARSQALQIASPDSQLIDLGGDPLPLWPSEDSQQRWPVIEQQLRKAEALIVISPEWHGMAAPAIKNFFLYANQALLGHKATLLVGISAGVGGAYPISELRASGYKNCRIGYIPEHLIIRHVESVLNQAEPESEADQRIRTRADYALKVLQAYATALAPIREMLLQQQPSFATGM